MLTDEEVKSVDDHFLSFIHFLQEYYGMSEEEALREIELRLNLMKAKKQQNQQ